MQAEAGMMWRNTPTPHANLVACKGVVFASVSPQWQEVLGVSSICVGFLMSLACAGSLADMIE